MFDLTTLIEAGGYVGLAAIIFAETGLFFGFIFPGDTLLFTAGILAAGGVMNVWLLVAATSIAAMAGDSFGYWSGRLTGPLIFNRPESFWFHQDRVESAKKFFAKYGATSVIFAHFVPVVRTFVPLVAGVAHMPYQKFLLFNVIGVFLWAFCLPLAGYYLGAAIPDIERYVFPIVAVGILFPFLIPFIARFLIRKSTGA